MENIKIDLSNMSYNEIKNIGRLIEKANNLGFFDYNSACCYIGYNANYGNLYLYSEDKIYTLFINCNNPTIKALYTCFFDGEETVRNASNDEQKMDAWADRLYQKSVKKEGI